MVSVRTTTRRLAVRYVLCLLLFPCVSFAQGPSLVPVLDSVPGYTALQKGPQLKVALRQIREQAGAEELARPQTARDLKELERLLQKCDAVSGVILGPDPVKKTEDLLLLTDSLKSSAYEAEFMAARLRRRLDSRPK
jgi:hypothetical protein